MRGCREAGSNGGREAAGRMAKPFRSLSIPACEMDLAMPAMSTAMRMEEVLGSQCSSPGSADPRGGEEDADPLRP